MLAKLSSSILVSILTQSGEAGLVDRSNVFVYFSVSHVSASQQVY